MDNSLSGDDYCYALQIIVKRKPPHAKLKSNRTILTFIIQLDISLQMFVHKYR